VSWRILAEILAFAVLAVGIGMIYLPFGIIASGAAGLIMLFGAVSPPAD
jgi:uncharacterized membrane-anchored protein YitT (DUF2179 family)